MIQIPQYRELVATFTHLPVAIQHKTNIGDNIQSVAAEDLWDVHEYCNRNRPDLWDEGWVVPMHGWYGGYICQSRAQCILLGMHLDYRARIKIMTDKPLRQWLRMCVKEQGFPALARDTSTRDFFRSVHIESEFAGCVSQTLPRYDGPREGVLNTDRRWTDAPMLEQTITRANLMGYDFLLKEARDRIVQFQRAEEVWTARLHVLLPCRALGTPVKLQNIWNVFEPHRFSGHSYDVEPLAYDLRLPSTAG